MSKKQFVIGDVHGEYETLLALIEKLPEEHELIFVGDLIDRGPKSKEVVDFVKKNFHACVLGNHEQLMLDASERIIQAFLNNETLPYSTSRWLQNGGKQTLQSYDLIETVGDTIIKGSNQIALYDFIEDVNWVKSLPLYIKLNTQIQNKPVVITHASCANVWHFHDDESNQETFEEYALWNRKTPREDVAIFNIYGHTPVEEIHLNQHYLNIDTGCTYGLENDLGELSAYCVQTGQIIQQKRVR